MMWNGTWSAADWLLMSLLMLVWWAAVVAAVLWTVATVRHQNRGERDHNRADEAPSETSRGHRPVSPAAFAALDERLARGDLTAEEYQARRDLLSSR
jgi:uncharacterized membrane protein